MARALTPLLLLVAGCAGGDLRPGAHDPETVTSAINLSGYPPEFRRGFTDGCSVARGGWGTRPKGDEAYAVGWGDGFDYCRARPAKPRSAP